MIKLLNGKDSFYQWDSNQKIVVADETVTEVHFSNSAKKDALICEVYEENGVRVAEVPNILLQEVFDILAYAYCGECYTKQHARYKVIARAKPSDYIYTETEVKSYEAYEERLKALEENASAVGKTTEENGEVFNDYEKNIANAAFAHAEGEGTQALAQGAHAEGRFNKVEGKGSHAEGRDNTVSGSYSHIEGYGNRVTADRAHAEGGETVCCGYASHTEGTATETTGSYSHAEGFGSKAKGEAAHAEGKNTTSSAIGSHSEGELTTASGNYSHTEGYRTTATAECTHAEGYQNKSTAFCAHCEGNGNEASGNSSHAEGYHTKASGFASHAGGKGTISDTDSQTAIGKYNATNKSALLIVGNGTESARSNAFEVINDGSIVVGGVTLTPDKLQALLNLLG